MGEAGGGSVGVVVLVGADVLVGGGGVSVSGSVGGTSVDVDVEKSGTSVTPGVLLGIGVRGGTFGTQSNCPARMAVELPRQLDC